MWKEITVNTTSEGADFVAAAFFGIGSQGVRIVDKNDVLDVMKSGLYWDYVDEKLLSASDTVTVSGFAADTDAEASAAALLDELNAYSGINLGSLEINIRSADEENWYENWKKYFRPVAAGRYLVQPEWLAPEAGETRAVVRIDPGMAFGSGEHESTRLCLTLMSDADFTGKSVIDVGTGSGILGIAALLSGADGAYMCDVDSCAVRAAKDNAALNGVSDRARIEAGDLLAGGAAPADYIFANLTADILVKLAETASSFLKPGGRLICSGILNTKAHAVKESFAARGMSTVRAKTQGDWTALELVKA